MIYAMQVVVCEDLEVSPESLAECRDTGESNTTSPLVRTWMWGIHIAQQVKAKHGPHRIRTTRIVSINRH